MKKPLSAVNVFAIVIGVFLVIEGLWGLFSEVVFFILSTNFLHAVIHLVLGFTALYLGLRNRARRFCIFLGILLIGVGVLFYVPVVGPFLADLFNLNNAVAILNIIVGIASILFAKLTPTHAAPGQHQ